MWALAVNQHLTVLFIALNRLSAIVFPHEHKRVSFSLKFAGRFLNYMSTRLLSSLPSFIIYFNFSVGEARLFES